MNKKHQFWLDYFKLWPDRKETDCAKEDPLLTAAKAAKRARELEQRVSEEREYKTMLEHVESELRLCGEAQVLVNYGHKDRFRHYFESKGFDVLDSSFGTVDKVRFRVKP